MIVPPQGFRHAVDLLLKNRCRQLPVDVEALARELVALADDMNADPSFAAWVIEEFQRLVLQPAPPVLAQLGSQAARGPERRDLFLIYVPEDRLPIAAPLAVELAKRRVSVAFSDFEVESETQLAAARARGRALHRAGALLLTPDFRRRGLAEPPSDPHLTILGHPTSPSVQAEGLVRWLSTFRTHVADCSA